MKGVVDYLKENKIYKHDAIGRDFELELDGKVVTLKYHGHEFLIAAKSNRHVEDEIQFILEDNFKIEIRFCRACGKPFDSGMTDLWDFYSCEECFEGLMNKECGEGKWRCTEDEGENGGFYERLLSDGTWEDTGVFYTEWY